MGVRWLVGAQSLWPQLGAGSGLGPVWCEEGAFLHGDALVSGGVCAGVAALAQAGRERVSLLPPVDPGSILGDRHECRNLISFS